MWLQTPNNKANMAALTIDGGTLEARDGAALYVGGTRADNSEVSIDINDGTIGGTGLIIQGPLTGTYGHLAVTGGQIEQVQCGANVEGFITGGYYKVEPPANYVGATGEAFGLVVIDEAGWYTLTNAEIDRYWTENASVKHEYYLFGAPFKKGLINADDNLDLLNNVTLTEDLACQLTEGSFTMNFDEYTVTKNGYSISLKPGVTVLTDKQTDIFTAADEGHIIEQETTTGYSYTVLTEEEYNGTFTLIDGEPYERTKNWDANTITYRRTFKDSQVGKYQAWFVPFDYTIKNEDAENFTFYKIDFVSHSPLSGVVEDNSAVFINIEVLTAGKTLKGNRPYIVKPNTAETFDFVAENVNLLGIDESSRLKMSTSVFEYNFYGNYGTYSTSSDHELLAMNGGQICWNTAGAKLGSYRWYIKASSNFSDDDYSKLRFIIIGDEEDNPTAIDDVNTVDDAIDAYYKVDGMKLESPAKGLNIVTYKSGRTKKVYIQ